MAGQNLTPAQPRRGAENSPVANQPSPMKYLQTVVRVTHLEASLRFYRDALRLPRDGAMAFVRSPDSVSIEPLHSGPALPPAEPWASMPNSGSW
jgi:hypothetical protein